MADFIEDDVESVDSQCSFVPAHRSPSPDQAPWSAQWSSGSMLDPRGRAQRPVIPSSSVDARSDRVTVEKDRSLTSSSSDAGSDEVTVEEDRSQAQSTTPRDVGYRPVRKAAMSAYSPMRKYARMDMGYVSDIAEADDSDDPDELDDEAQCYAPFETQVQSELDDKEWGDVPECEDVGAVNANVKFTSDKLAELANAAETESYIPLIDAALDAENESGTKLGVFLSGEREYWQAMSMVTLCSMPERAVKELVCGNLKQAYDSDPELREMLDRFEERGKQHPCIYARTLTTRDGTLMTVAETRRLARWLQRYVSTSADTTEHPRCKEAFKRIDHQFRAQWKRVNPGANRAFLASKNQTRVQQRADNVNVFCRQLIARCETSEKEGVPLKPLTYIGYAGRSDRRRRQHEACGKSANWLATLVQAVCNVLWGHGHFQMHFMVVCLISSEPQGMVAEMLLTRITGAYYSVGGGFCIDVAGKSMESLHFNSLTHRENVDKWNELAEWVAHETPLEINKAACVQRRSAALERETAAIVAGTEEKIARMKPMLLKHFVCQASLTKMLEEARQDGVEVDEELVRKIEQYARDFADVGAVFRRDAS